MRIDKRENLQERVQIMDYCKTTTKTRKESEKESVDTQNSI